MRTAYLLGKGKYVLATYSMRTAFLLGKGKYELAAYSVLAAYGPWTWRTFNMQWGKKIRVCTA